MAQIPTNQKMWNMFVAQAKARFAKWPSASASNWVHQHYVQAGGKFASSVTELSPADRREKAKADSERDDTKRRIQNA